MRRSRRFGGLELRDCIAHRERKQRRVGELDAAALARDRPSLGDKLAALTYRI
jgi:hypothetical protein